MIFVCFFLLALRRRLEYALVVTILNYIYMTASWGLLLLLEASPWRLWLLGSTITIEKRIIKRSCHRRHPENTRAEEEGQSMNGTC